MIKIHRRITLFWCGASQYYTLICTIDKTNTNNTNNSNNNEKHIGLHYSMCIHNTAQPLYQLPSKMGNTHSHTHTYSPPLVLSLTHARARSSFLLHTAFSFQSAPIGRSVDQSFALIRKINEKSILMMKAYILFTYTHTHTKPKSLANASSFIKLSLFIYVFCCWRYRVCVCAIHLPKHIL